MRRRSLVTTCASLLATPAGARAQTARPIYRIGWLAPGAPTPSNARLQDSFREGRAARQGGKVVREGVICLEKGEDFWRFNLKGEIFTFGSFKGPSVRLEREDVADPQREREAVFYERMHIVEEGLQLFDSLLAVFLRERLGDSWGDLQHRVDQWLAEG